MAFTRGTVNTFWTLYGAIIYLIVTAVAGGIQACTENGTVPQIIRQCKLSATAALTLQL